METLLFLSIILVYYVTHGRRFLSLERIPEPAFVVNILYILNFPLRAICLSLIPETVHTAPNFILNANTLDRALIYSFACIVVFNISYEYFLRPAFKYSTRLEAPHVPLNPVPAILYSVYLLLALVYLYYALTSGTNKTFLPTGGQIDIPRVIRQLHFTLPFIILASFMMFLLTKWRPYILVFGLFSLGMCYNAFLLTAKYPVLAYLVLLALVAARVGHRIRPQLIATCILLIIPYVIYTYLGRSDLALVSPEVPFSERMSVLGDLLSERSPYDLFQSLFLLKITDRHVYLDTLMLYFQAEDLSVSVDLYDHFGSLPVLPSALLNLFTSDTHTIENIHTWFGNKYWYGSWISAWEVVIPFGRITESYMIFGVSGFLMFVGYAYLFALVYRVFYLSSNPMMAIYYLLIYYYYILVNEYLFYNFSILLYMSMTYFAVMLCHSAVSQHLEQQQSDSHSRSHA